jgi:RNA polymerase sigma-70 factor (sigma-E family)
MVTSVEFEDYVLARGAQLISFATVLCGDRHLAEDLVQSALVKVHRNWRRIGDQHPDPYVRRAIVSCHVDHRRLRRNGEAPAIVELDLDPTAPTDPTPDPGFSVPERLAMWQALATLPSRQRAVLVLRYYSGLDDAAVAATLQCGQSTVRSQAARALATLRRQFEPE